MPSTQREASNIEIKRATIARESPPRKGNKGQGPQSFHRMPEGPQIQDEPPKELNHDPHVEDDVRIQAS